MVVNAAPFLSMLLSFSRVPLCKQHMWNVTLNPLKASRVPFLGTDHSNSEQFVPKAGLQS